MIYKSLGAILIILSLILSIGAIKDFKTMNSGKIVEVKVLKVLTSCEISNSSLRARFKFIFKNKVHTKKIKGKKYCNIIKDGATIKLKTNKSNTVFLYPDENILLDNIANIVLFIVGVLMLFKKEKK